MIESCCGEASLIILSDGALWGWARERLPFIIHLHTAAEFIRRFAGEPGTPPDFIPIKRMEEFCIRAADAL